MGALALVGCGVTIDTGGTRVGGGTSTTPGQNAGGSSGSGTQTGPGGGMVAPLNPCPGTASAPTHAPTLILTVEDSHKTTQAHVGDVIEVQLPATMNWSGRNDATAATLTALQPQGGIDQQSHTCRWVYTVKASGTTTLTFIGLLPCDTHVACPAIAEDEEFTIQAS